MYKYIALFCCYLPCWLVANAQSPIGQWILSDKDSGEERLVVEIYQEGPGQFGRVVELLKAKPHNCDKCTDYRKGQSVVNMIVMENMLPQKGLWSGKALLPRHGKWVTTEYWLKEGDPNTLVVRGYFGLFFRTDYWKRRVGARG